MITLTCPRCNGTGNYSYHPLHGTVCFKCDGAGTVEYTESQYKAMQKRRAKAEEKKELEAEARRARIAFCALVNEHLINRYKDTKEFKYRTKHWDGGFDAMPRALKEEAALLVARDELDGMGVQYFNSHRGIFDAYVEHIYSK